MNRKPPKTTPQKEPWMEILWNAKDLPEGEAAARRSIDLAGLKAIEPIRAKLHNHITRYVKKPATIEKVLPPVLVMIDEAHADFMHAAALQFDREPGRALIEAAAENWVAEDANVAVQQLTWAGRDGLMQAEVALDSSVLGRERKWRPHGDSMIAYACGLKPDFTSGDWYRAVSSKIEARRERLWPSEEEIRRLFREVSGPARKLSREQLILLAKRHPKLQKKELAKLSGWSQSELSRGILSDQINRAQTLQVFGELFQKRDQE